MDLILAIDLKNGQIVHGKSGMRSTYRPIDFGPSSSSEPVHFLSEIAPKYLYVADLDRISGGVSHDGILPSLAGMVEQLYIDRGSTGPDDLFVHDRIVNIIGTETAGSDLSGYQGGYLSVDVKEGRVIPGGMDPVSFMKDASRSAFDGCILLNIGGVGTRSGLEKSFAEDCRSSWQKKLFWGGGISGYDDLDLLAGLGYDGAIIATALHSGTISLSYIRSGSYC